MDTLLLKWIHTIRNGYMLVFEWIYKRIDIVLNGYTYLLYGFMISKMDNHLSKY